MENEEVLYWAGYSEKDEPTSKGLNETLKDAHDEWNANADEPIEELGAQVIEKATDFYNTVGSINTEIILAMITQLQ